MNPQRKEWTQPERLRALNAFLESEEGRRFREIFSRDCASAEDRVVFLGDAERRAASGDEAASRWWNSLLAMLNKHPDQALALAEPLAQHGLLVEELHENLPEDFEPQALMQAIARAVSSPGSLGISVTTDWPEERIRARLEEVKTQLDWDNTGDGARKWWHAFETENDRRPALALRLAEELAVRKATIAEFHDANVHSDAEDIQANLHFLDYSRLKAAEAAQPVGADGRRLTSGDSGWWLKPAEGATKVRGWTDERIRSLLEKVKTKLEWESASEEARELWNAFENENARRLALVLRLAETLTHRNVTIAAFHEAFKLSAVNDVQANLSFIEYTRLKNVRRFVEELIPGVTLEMIEIPGGKFLMGSDEYDNEKPIHEVAVPPFYIGKFTVTQKQWSVVAGWEKVERDLDADPSRFKGEDRPVETISWEDATEFCARLSRKTGREYRLPTEAEWEYACRAGTTGPYAGNLDAMGWYNKNSGNETHPVGQKQPNAWGLYDMHGNVWEWCEDTWHENYEGVPDDGRAWVTEGAPGRVDRGGGWTGGAVVCRSAYRYYDRPGYRYDALGFRLVRTYP